MLKQRLFRNCEGDSVLAGTNSQSSVVLIVSCLLSLVMLLAPARAYAWTSSGSHWNGSTQRISLVQLYGNYQAGIVNAISSIDSKTDVHFSFTTASEPSWKARVNNYGNTGWEGQSTWSYYLGATHSADSKLNMYYLNPNTSVAQLKVVWLHELCHVWGLGHVDSINSVMYKSASEAYRRGGVRDLVSDDINGINHLY